MARTLLPVEDVGRDGVTTWALAQTIQIANGAKFRNTGREWLKISNATGGDASVTVPIPRLIDGMAVDPQPYTIPAGGLRYIPPFPTDPYNQVNEMVYIDTDTIVTMAVFRDGT
jgi:hypothetical protein